MKEYCICVFIDFVKNVKGFFQEILIIKSKFTNEQKFHVTFTQA